MLSAMAKKIDKKPSRSQQGQRLSALWLCFLMFVFGYLAASWFDVNQFGSWVGTHLKSTPTDASQVQKKSMLEKPPTEQHPKLEFYTLLSSDTGLHMNSVAKPTTETETVNMQYKTVPAKPNNPVPTPPAQGPMELAVTVPAPTPTAIPVPAQAPSKPARVFTKAAPEPVKKEKLTGRYMIQVGSFRGLADAKRLRDRLVARGFATEVVPVKQQSIYWYRVIVGPFSSLTQAQQAQASISRYEHMTGMIRKIGG